MKILLIIIMLLCVGCNKNNMNINYDKYLEELNAVNESSQFIPCNIEITYDKITDEEVSYQITFDNAIENMKDIDIVLTHNIKTDDGYPSIGIYDIEPINLLKEPADNNTKGIILVGYFKYSRELDELNAEFKILINYKDDAGKEKTVYFIKTI